MADRHTAVLVVNKSDLTNDASTRRHTSIIGYRFAIPFFRCHLSRHCQLSRCAQRRSIVIWSKEPRFDAPSENKFILCPQTLSFHRHPVIQVKIHTTYALRYIQKAKEYTCVRLRVPLKNTVRKKSQFDQQLLYFPRSSLETD